MRKHELLRFMIARHTIYQRKAAGEAPPWTCDSILQKYKFCNVYRELDKVTVWVRKHIREPYADHPNLWFMLCIARQINWPPTLQYLMDEGCWPVYGDRWSWQDTRATMLGLQNRGEKIYTSAYMLNAHGKPGDPTDKAFFTCRYVLGDVWEDRKPLLHYLSSSLQTAADALAVRFGWGGFTAAQVVADLKYTHYLSEAPDWWSWAASGPGSRRGMNRLMNLPVKKNWNEEAWRAQLRKVQSIINAHPFFEENELHAQDMQNCLCEWDKYERARLGEGRPKAFYKSEEETT